MASSFTNNGDGTGELVWIPMLDDIGDHPGQEFSVSDGELSDSETISISVQEQGTVTPASVSARTWLESAGGSTKQWNHPYDPATEDRVLVVLHAESLPERVLLSVTYNGGYSTIPEDVQQATIQVMLGMYSTGAKDPSLKSEKLGEYSYTLNTSYAGSSISPMVEGLLTRYRRVEI